MNAQPTTTDELGPLVQQMRELLDRAEQLMNEPEDSDAYGAAFDNEPSEMLEHWPDIDSAVFRELQQYGQCDPESLACKLITRPLEQAGVSIEDLIVSVARHCEDYEKELEFDSGIYSVDDPAMFIADVPHLGALPKAGPDWRYKVAHFKYRQALQRHGFSYAERHYGQYAEPYTPERAQIAYNNRRRFQMTKMEQSDVA